MTFNPATLDIASLPSLPLSERKTLPQRSGYYFVLSDDEKIIYIGMTRDLRVRWYSHNKHKQMVEHGAARIAYLIVERGMLFIHNEMALIQHYDPPLNQIRNTHKPGSDTRFIIELPKNIDDALRQDARKHGMSRKAFVEQLLTERYATALAA